MLNKIHITSEMVDEAFIIWSKRDKEKWSKVNWAVTLFRTIDAWKETEETVDLHAMRDFNKRKESL